MTVYGPIEPSVRGMPPGARGTRGHLQADTLLDLGALAAANGMTRAQVERFLDAVQEAALAATLASAPRLLRQSRNGAAAKINEILVRVNQLRPIMLQQPVGLLGTLLPNRNLAMQDVPVYVNLADVQNAISLVLSSLATEDPSEQ
jgi:hypothetical protein